MALHFQGSLAIHAPRDRVWAFLTDPRAVARCLPDVQRLEVLEEGTFKATVRVGVGFIKGDFAFDVAMADLHPPVRAVLTGRGGGLGSAVDVRSTIGLADGEGGATRLDWTADVVVSGTIASVGARVLRSTVEKKAGELFACLKAQLEG
ncbi:MAG: carbon monoxide dehydrogenase subunit G [Armatimonadota bacterium]|nr:carbon monoxide dehydrogenase subunit G [Armatimonadota bacterium]MDR7519885.1 carbon monoxide dehydrogenase subunit G [Armatimonadota bacterium]